MSELQVKELLLKLLREDLSVRAALASIVSEHLVLTELKALREDFNRHEAENAKRFKAFEEQMAKLREDFNYLSHWLVGIAGYRWGMASEEAFRQAVDYIAKSLGYPIAERRVLIDRDGSVTGIPGREVDVNVCVKDGVHLLIEVTMSAKREDLWKLAYAARLYEKETGVKPSLVLISPYVPAEVHALAQRLGVVLATAWRPPSASPPAIA